MKMKLAVLAILVVTAKANDEFVPEIYAVAGSSANLPCNLKPPDGKDTARLVLWYKNSDPQPVYSFDARFSTVKHWSEDPAFGARSFFRDSVDPAELILSSVTMDDAGIYKCRVDFRKSPTVMHAMRLHIVEQPDTPVILDGEGSSVMGNLGPYRLGQPLILVCLVEGGKPKPEVNWYRDGVVWDTESDPSTYENIQQNTLVVSELAREHHNSIFECRAFNNNVKKSPRSKVRIVMEMPILYMTISNLPDPVVANTEYEVLCQVVGAQPPPVITWSLDGALINATSPDRLSNQGNMSTSTLAFKPTIQDQGKTLRCDATHEIFKQEVPSNVSRVLNIYYLPIVHMEITNGIDPTNIGEGTEVVMKCLIQAHPWIWRILWYKDGEELVPSDSVMIDEHTLRLRNISKQMSGQYVCSAANVEGDGFSKPQLITVNYKPVCISSTINHQPREEEGGQGVELLCQVDSKPKSFTYRWLFNSSDTKFEIPSAESSMTFQNYLPSDGAVGDGQVLCWASNELGEQSVPCVFYVVPLATPHPPTDCEITNTTDTTLEVSCIAGFDGGMEQHFVIEVFANINNSQVLVASNWTDEEPVISAWGLEPHHNYIISVKAVNDRGESTPVFVGGRTGDGSASYLPISIDQSRLPFLIVIVVILISVVLVGSFIAVVLASRYRKKQQHVNLKSVADTSDLTEEQLEQFREAEAMLEQAELIQTTPPPSPTFSKPPSSITGTIQRKVSFRDDSSGLCPQCSCGGYKRQQRSSQSPGFSNGTATLPLLPQGQRVNGIYPPVQRAIIKSFSIDKMRPICPVCNPAGDTPYPPDYPVHPSQSSSKANSSPETDETCSTLLSHNNSSTISRRAVAGGSGSSNGITTGSLSRPLILADRDTSPVSSKTGGRNKSTQLTNNNKDQRSNGNVIK